MPQTTILEHTEDSFNSFTGEVTEVKKHVIRRTSIEPTDEFVKVSRYLHTIFAYHEIPLNLVGISLCIAQKMEFKTNKVYLLKSDKIEIGEMLGLGKRYKKNGKPDTNTVDKLIRDLKKYDIVRPTDTRGVYEVNGYLFSSGSVVDTRNIQAHFDFEHNIVTTQADMKHRITGETVRKSVSNKRLSQIPGQMSLFDSEEETK
jgi:hypothetical protein